MRSPAPTRRSPPAARAPPDGSEKISQQRAEAVRAYLTGKGVDPARLEAAGYGEEKPVAPNDTAEGREANRRVEFSLGM